MSMGVRRKNFPGGGKVDMLLIFFQIADDAM